MAYTYSLIFTCFVFCLNAEANNEVAERRLIKEYDTILTAYYPDTFNDDETGMMDMNGNRLRTLQDYLDGRSPYVTVSTDPRLKIPYGTKVRIPSLENHFGVKGGIQFEARDTGSYMDGAGFTRIDVCVRSEQDSYDLAVNKEAKVIFYFPGRYVDNELQNLDG